jgi:hypothetical protein
MVALARALPAAINTALPLPPSNTPQKLFFQNFSNSQILPTKSNTCKKSCPKNAPVQHLATFQKRRFSVKNPTLTKIILSKT